jgi:hypothetical protein
VEGGHRLPGSDRGGESIQALRARPSLTTGTASALLAAALAFAAGSPDPALLALGGASVFVLVVGLALGRAAAVPWAVVGLGAEYAVSLRGEELDGRVPLFAVGLLVVAELAYWALQLRRGPRDEPGMAQGRIVALLIAGTTGLIAGSLLVVVGSVPLRGGLAVEALGLTAAVGALMILLSLARRA